jgi:glutaredoxin
MKIGVLIFWSGIVLVIVLSIVSILYLKQKPSQLDGFAQCLKEKGVIMYGAFWCPHCQRTKALFGSAQKYIPYVECSTADGKEQLQICKDKGIKNYPTWVFPNGENYNGERTLAEIASSSQCVLP